LSVVGLIALGAGLGPVLAGKPQPPVTAERRASDDPFTVEGRVVLVDERPDNLRRLEAVKWYLLRVDVAKRTLHISDTPAARAWKKDHAGERLFASAGAELSVVGLPVSKEAKIVLDGKDVPLKELHDGVNLTLKFEGDKLVVASIEATTPATAGYVVQAVDADKNVITVSRDKDDKPLVLPVAEAVLPELGGSLKNLQPGTHVQLHLGVEDGQLIVRGLRVR